MSGTCFVDTNLLVYARDAYWSDSVSCDSS
jgi:hypothetical protein